MRINKFCSQSLNRMTINVFNNISIPSSTSEVLAYFRNMGHHATLVSAFCVASFFQFVSAQQANDAIFVGATLEKAFFAVGEMTDWVEAPNMCLTRGLFSASVDSEEQNELVKAYLQSVGGSSPGFWLAATDFLEEGEFIWIRTRAPLTYANWTQGSPSDDESVNCVTIDATGQWLEEVCSSNASIAAYYPLCEIPLLNPNPKPNSITLNTYHQPHASLPEQTENSIPTQNLKRVDIGKIGDKTYHRSEETEKMKFAEALNYCHQDGYRLGSADTEEESKFLVDYMKDMAVNGSVNPMLLTSGTDLLTVDCDSSNSQYRWFVSNYPVTISHLGQHSGTTYNCLYLSPGGFYGADCTTLEAPVLCEDGPKPTPPPTGTTTTSTTPAPEGCGIIDHPPGSTIRIGPIVPNLPPGTEFWRKLTFNVNTTATVSHPHNKYLQALRGLDSYWFATTAEFPKFLEDEKPEGPPFLMLRTANMYCAVGSITSVQYKFEIEIREETPEITTESSFNV